MLFHPEYATLSHCWGTLSVLKLTSNNIRMLESGMSLNLLCKTFQHAANVLQLLGLEYIWIDSLCIIQDDKQDWNTESKRMGGIYGSSAINIAATSAKDGNGGLFFAKPDATMQTYRLKVQQRSGSSKWYDCIESGLADTCRYTTPLGERAWVLQERLLAPRTLHFGSSQIFWECDSLTACEEFPAEFPPSLLHEDFYFRKRHITIELWPRIVQIYSNCRLTFRNDKLIAISGLARHVQLQTQDDYFAGLWWTQIEHQLCWRSRTPSSRPVVAQAPSWSWAAVDGIVALPTNPATEVNVVVTNVNLLGLDPFGEVPNAYLTLRCEYLVRATLVFHNGSYLLESELGYLPAATDVDFDDISPGQVDVHLMPVIESVRGLIIERVKDQDGCIFRRIGHFHIRTTGDEAGYRTHAELLPTSGDIKHLLSASSVSRMTEIILC
jgi:hypothetical protein